MKTLIGIVTFGNLEFTRLTIQEIRATVQSPYRLFVVVGKPGDVATLHWLQEQRIDHLAHGENKGFPASLNDIYDYAWPSLAQQPLREGADYDAVIISGNDVIPYPGAIDALIECARTTDWEWIASSQFDVKSLTDRYPETRRYFQGASMVFSDFSARPWEVHRDFRAPHLVPDVIADVHNLCLFKRSVHEQIGYIDTNFFPAYFSDNDYCRRGNLAGLKTCQLEHSAYFHFWSRTIHQGSGGSNHHFFENNRKFYRTKWGGDFGGEPWNVPFNGQPHALCEGVLLKPSIVEHDRTQERKIVEYWRKA